MFSSPWDPGQLADYARVFAFENFRRAAKRAVQNAGTNAIAGVPVGAFVRVGFAVFLASAEALLSGAGAYKPSDCGRGDGPRGRGGRRRVGAMWNGWCGGAGPVILSSFAAREQAHGDALRGDKTPACEPPLRSKTPLWFHVGFRRGAQCPSSARTAWGTSTSSSDSCMRAGRASRASTPRWLTLPRPCWGSRARGDVSEARRGTGDELELVLSGSRRADPDRIILKRCILTGAVQDTKSKAVVRHMFFNPEDIRWFKPLELWTKYGMRGKITDAIGTHGHMKCLFNGVFSRGTQYADVQARVPEIFKRVRGSGCGTGGRRPWGT